MIGMRFIEQKFLFPAPTMTQTQLHRLSVAQNAAELALTAEDGTRLYGWYHRGQEPRRGVFVWFDGNGTAIGSRYAEHQTLQEAGFDIVWVSYRGYPGSGGEPSEPGLRQDARAAWKYAKTLGLPIFLYGKSLGGGVAVGLAGDPGVEGRPVGLIVESSFASAVEVAEGLFRGFPVRHFMDNHFDTLSWVTTHKKMYQSVRVLVMHGTADELIPLNHGERLAEALNGQFWNEPGGDHNAPIFLNRWDEVLAWINDTSASFVKPSVGL